MMTYLAAGRQFVLSDGGLARPLCRLPGGVQQFRFIFRARQPLLLPPFKGATFRGAFVQAYKRAVCTQDMASCETCLLRTACPFPLAVEPLPPQQGSPWARVADPPRGYVLRPPLNPRPRYAPGELFSLGLVLYGRTLRLLPYFIIALRQVGLAGLGAERSAHNGQAELLRVTRMPVTQEWDEGDTATLRGERPGETEAYGSGGVIAPPQEDELASMAVEGAARAMAARGADRRLTVQTLTPVRLKVRGVPLRDHLPFGALIRAALTRVSALSAVHGDGPLALDFYAAIDRAGGVRCIDTGADWWAARRYSSRQQRSVPIDGLVGRFVYEGDIAEFLPLLATAQVVHVGNGTTFGLGMVRCAAE